MSKPVDMTKALSPESLTIALDDRTITPEEVIATAARMEDYGETVRRPFSDMLTAIDVVADTIEPDQLGQLAAITSRLTSRQDINFDQATKLNVEVLAVMRYRGFEVDEVVLRAKKA